MKILCEADVQAAATTVIDAFAAADFEAYFECFAEDATFVFHSEPSRIESLEEYRKLWRGWQEAGWRVIECHSSGQAIQVAGTGAVFSHDVRTVVEVAGVRDVLHERESIIFSRTPDGGILAIHEHLSPASVS
ncbi:MAG: nuclear transport factor 2 family protein [Arthrobacter sp.]